MNIRKVLLIDDDAGFLYLAGLLFKRAGSTVISARSGLEGISKLFTHRPDLTILDVQMPDMDGFEVCRRIRQISDAPIIMLTALNDDAAILRGLDAGADDFLSKPYNPEILLARARTVLRRSPHVQSQTDIANYDDGHLSIDLEKREVLVDDQRIKLTPLEFRLLAYLVRNAGKVLTFEQILVNVWGLEYRGSVDYVHVHVSRLRTKIEAKPKRPRYITTVHGIGYMFER